MDRKVSIIIPIYNVAKFINRCVDSVIAQTYSNIEIILVDDESPDNCPEICEQYARRDDRIVVIHKKNGGLSDARNAGIEKASGDYIFFLDSDDYVEINLIERLILEAQNNESDVVICGYYADSVDSNETLLSSKNYKGINGVYNKKNFQKIPLDSNTVGLLGYAWNKLYKIQTINSKSHRFIKGLSLIEDIVFNGPVLEECNTISFIEDPLIHYMQRSRNTLGSKYYENYFDLKLIAINIVRKLLLFWGKQDTEITTITDKMGFKALKSTARFLSCAANYESNKKSIILDDLLQSYQAREILRNVKLNSLKDKFLKYLMLHGQSKIILNIYHNKNKS